jgi:SpoVK/Ycf46/Vps4 family AAA+-type ATPase
MAITIHTYLNAGYPVLYVRTGEQERAFDELIADLKLTGLADKLRVMIWKSTIGLYPVGAEDPEKARTAQGIDETLKYIAGNREGPRAEHLYVMFNARDFLKSPILMQQFRDTAYKIRAAGSYMILIGGAYEVPEELEDVITFVDLELPSKDELKAIFRDMVDNYRAELTVGDAGGDLDEALSEAAENALGLTAFKAENAISLSLASSKKIDIPLIRKEKQLAIKQSGVLEYLHHAETMDSLGGFDVLKAHVRKRRKYFRSVQAAEKFGLRPPKGVMLVGIAGCGKSLAAKAVGASLDLPVYKFDVGAVFKGIVGSSELAIRNALKLAETVAPCVLLIDEMEKLMSGLESSGRTDSGVTSRVLGTFISWMQETQAPIYKVATCNTIRNLDAALFRRGRWDSVFAVDLPVVKEREEIFSIHLTKRGREAAKFDLKALSQETENFVGAEIESVVDEALYIAFDADRELTTADMLAVAKSIIPISKTDKEAIAEFRTWMTNRAMPVSSSAMQSSAQSSSSHAVTSARAPRNLRV